MATWFQIPTFALPLLSLLLIAPAAPSPPSPERIPTPKPWPHQFRALLSMSLNESNQITELYYDWPRGRNVNLIHKQLGPFIHDVEWDNGTTFYYTLAGEGGGDDAPTCRVEEFGVGIPRPDFLDGADYLGTKVVDGFLCNTWNKLDFIWYYEDVATKRPVRWDFYQGIVSHVITFEAGVSLPDSYFQAPEYCFAALHQASN